MPRPRLLLVPNFTELEWVIKPRLEEWAEVISFDPPGIGEEPHPSDADREASQGEEPGIRELVARRGLEKAERAGWDRYFVVADGEGNGAAALVAASRPDAVEGIALGHACTHYEMSGEHAAVSSGVWDAMAQLLENNREGFVRTALVQVTGKNYRDELAERMLERFNSQAAASLWKAIRDEPIRIDQLVREVGAPLLLVKHEGCLMFTDEGFRDATVAFRGAQAITLPEPACLSEAFAGALRSFCERRAGA